MPAFDATTPSTIQALAAVVQAATALVIVWLTLRLSATARNALEASQAQAAAASRSIEETRRQGQLEAIPLLSLDRPTYRFSGQLELSLFLANSSDHAALGVAVSIFAEHDRGRPETNARIIRSKIPLIPPGGQLLVTLNGHDVQNFGSRDDAGTPTPMFSNDWLLIAVEFAGLRGARVQQRYEWHANYKGQSEPSTWHLLDVTYSHDGSAESAVVVRP
jgi:hypothetical protein